MKSLRKNRLLTGFLIVIMAIFMGNNVYSMPHHMVDSDCPLKVDCGNCTANISLPTPVQKVLFVPGESVAIDLALFQHDPVTPIFHPPRR